MDCTRLAQVDLSRALGIPARTIRSWDGLPRNPDKSYSLPIVVQWLIDRAEDDSPSVETDPESRQWLAKFRRERFKLAKIERLKTQGELIPRDIIGRAWTRRISEVCNGLAFLVNRLPPMLAGKDQRQMYDIIEDEVRRLRENYVRGGPYCRLPAGCIYEGGSGCDGRLPPPQDPGLPPGEEEEC